MAHNVSNEYKQIIYSGDARNKLKLLFNNVELEEADRYCEKMTIKSRIVPNGAKIFSLNNFISKEVELILHDIDTSIIQDQVSISIGTLVGNNYEYVPIGIFNIQNQPTNDKNKTTIKLRDNSVKFDFNYNAQPLIEENGGSATKLQILQDICTQAGVTCNITSFIGYLDEIGIYDNTITARKYIADIAEQAGKIATINRSGELIFVDLNNLTTWEIPIEVVEKYESGTKFKVGKVVYEDGIVRYETEDSNDDTLFLDGSNDYINGEKIVEQASSSNNFYSLQDTGEAKLKYFQMEGKTEQKQTTPNKNLLYINSVASGSGVTITRYSNSEIVITGTSTSSVTITIPLNSHQLSNQPYTISAIVTGTINKEIYIDLNTTNDLGLEIDASGTFTQSSLTETSSSVVTEMALTFNNSTTFNDVHIKLQLEQSSTATSYIESQLPMPSPDYPSKLNSVGYENIINFANREYKITNYYYRDFGTGILITEDMVGKVVSISYDVKISDYSGSQTTFVGVIGRSTNNSVMQNNIKTSGYLPMPNELTNIKIENITIPDYVGQYLIFRPVGFSSPSTANIEASNVQLTYSSTAHTYIPYGKYGIEVKTIGKNLFDKNSYQNLSTSYEYNIASYHIRKIQLEPNTNYTVSHNAPSSSDVVILINNIQQVNGTNYYDLRNASGTKTITTDSTGCLYIGVVIAFTNEQYNDRINECNIQIEKGNTTTTYEAYKENSQLYTLDKPIRSIGDIKDLLYIRNGMLYVDRKIGKVVFNGSEGWGKGAVFYLSTAFPNDNKAQSANLPLSNYFGASANASVDNTIFIPGTAGTSNRMIWLKSSKFDTANDLKTWLSTHNTEVQYPLATPYIEELGTIEVPSTYEEITYIDILSNIDTNTYLQYREDKTQVEAILNEVDEFDIDSLKTGKILGNPAIDSYDLIQIHDKSSNLLKYPYYATLPTTQAGVTWNDDKGKITASGTATGYSGFTLVSNIPVQANTNYRFYIVGTQTNVSIDISGSGLGINIPTTSLNNSGFVFNTGNATAITLNVKRQNSLPVTADFYPMLVIGTNTSVDYKPYYDNTYTTLATNDLVYTGVLINTFDTQIGEEAKEQNVFVNGEETFKKWARTKIDNVEGTLTLQAGEINEVNGKLNSTTLQINSQGALLDVLANKSNIDVEYDSEGNPLNGEVREVTTTTGFKFNAEGMTIEDSSSNFKSLHTKDGTYYKEGEETIGQYTKDGSKQKDLELFGTYYYGKENINDTPMFVAQLYTDGNGEEAFGHFYNRGD